MKSKSSLVRWAVCAALLSGWIERDRAQAQISIDYDPPGLKQMVDGSASELRDAIALYSSDRSSVNRMSVAQNDADHFKLLGRFHRSWLERLAELDFDGLSRDGQIDYIMLRSRIEQELRDLERESREYEEIAPLILFAGEIIDLEKDRRRVLPLDATETASHLAELSRLIDEARKGFQSDGRARGMDPEVAGRVRDAVDELRDILGGWFRFYNGYDPMFTWWVEEPNRQLDEALEAFAEVFPEGAARRGQGRRQGRGRGRGRGQGRGRGRGRGGAETQAPSQEQARRSREPEPIEGTPIGRDALLRDLADEMIPYSPQELIEIANWQFAFCDREMLRASRDLGYGDDWHAALEHVKKMYVDPGDQPRVIKELAEEATRYMEEHDLLTVPELAKNSWGIQMMSAQRQLVNPFFTGGQTISVSFPTNGMSHEAKMMSMRGNNVAFSKATVFHELIPGHHLQGFMTGRYNTHRGMFNTPFWGEGWALYWELLLWDMGFQRTPEERIGALFWRMHRCARIIFSLKFHLGEMTPQECVDFLVERVGHERANAEGEVRRSFAGSYSPLYQCAYMLGGMQFYALHHELVDSGKMTNRAFHDAILKANRIPVEMVRALLTDVPLTPDYKSNWRFADDVPGLSGG